MEFSKLFSLYVAKAERKGRTADEVREVICWLCGYSPEDLLQQIDSSISVEAFFKNSPAPHPNRVLIKGSICGVKIADITEPFDKEIRYLDKLIDELAKGKAMEKILRVK